MAKNTHLRCYLESLSQRILSLELPHDSPVIIGRMSEFQITDKCCSRNQLELRANYDKKYVLVKRLGINPSQIDGIEIHRHLSTRLTPGQKLYIVNMKYPYHVIFKDSGEIVDAKTTDENLVEQCNAELSAKRRKRNHDDDKDSAQTSKTSRRCTEQLNYLTKDSENCDINISEQSCKPSVASVSSGNTHHWIQGLKMSMKDPKFIIHDDEKVVAIKDKYPKFACSMSCAKIVTTLKYRSSDDSSLLPAIFPQAKFHWLILPHDNISNPYKLTSDHIELLKHILSVGKILADRETAKEKKLEFRFGYHAVASMSQLHMHVISQDFDSACLKTKKHWNSFTTDYFVDAEDIICDLERDGKVKDRRFYTELLKKQLRCHHCDQPQKNMPELKKHILICKKT